jgi:hypothetical protein
MKPTILQSLLCLSCFLIFEVKANDSPVVQQQLNKNTLINIFNRIEKKYQQIELSQLQDRKIPIAAKLDSDTPAATRPEFSPYATYNDENQAPLLPIQQSAIPDGEALLLGIYVEQLSLADVFGYKSLEGAKISLENFFEVLDFPIEIDMEKKIAKGWFIREENLFEFNFQSLNEGVAPYIQIGDKVSSVDTDVFIFEDNEIYVDGNILSEWFALNLNYDFGDMRVNLNPVDPLPIQIRLARRNKNVSTSTKSESTLPWKDSAYQRISSPLVDVQMQHSSSSRDNSGFTSYSALGSHDLAYMNTEYYLAGRSQGGLSDARVKFSEELKAGTFWILPSANVEFGDINSVSITSEYNGGLNRGVSFSKTNSNLTNNQRININGDIQPGWDIELYQNNILIAQQTSVQTGRYEFNNIDLNFGNNSFEIISYGPQGQVETEYKEMFIDKNALTTSENDYAFSITQLGKSLLGVNDEIVTSNNGLLFAGRYSLGITDWFSLTLGQSTLLSDQAEDEYNFSAATNITLFERLLLNTNININQDNNYSSDLTARTQWFGQSLLYNFRQRQSEELITDNSQQKFTDKQHLFKMSGKLFNLKGYRMNYNNQFISRNDINGIKTTRLQNQLSLSAGRFSIQHALDWQKIQSTFGSNENLFGFMQVQRNIGRVFSRFSTSYSIHPEIEINNVKAELSWNILNDLQSEITLNYLAKTDIYRTELGLNWQHDKFNLSSNLRYDDQDDWTFGLYLRFGIGYDFENHNAFMSSANIARNGAMAVRVFEDENNDGLFNEGENIIEGVKVKALQSQRQATSDANGVALIHNLRNQVPTDIVIDNTTLGDPFLMPSSQGISITPRKGFLDKADYPVVTSGEIDGTIYTIDSRGNENNLAYVAINLLDQDGKIVTTTQSEYDGYYLFVDLIPGQYHVSIAEEYLKRHKLENIENLAVNLTVQGDVINGSDFTLLQLDFTEGFAVTAGTFNSLTMLKVYWHLMQRRYRARLKQTAFYVENESSGRYSLNLAFYPDKSEAYQACEQIAEADIQCDVEAFEFVSQ